MTTLENPRELRGLAIISKGGDAIARAAWAVAAAWAAGAAQHRKNIRLAVKLLREGPPWKKVEQENARPSEVEEAAIQYLDAPERTRNGEPLDYLAACVERYRRKMRRAAREKR